MVHIMKKFIGILTVAILMGCNGEPVPAMVRSHPSLQDSTVGELPIRLTTAVPDAKFSDMQFKSLTSDNYSGEYIEFIE